MADELLDARTREMLRELELHAREIVRGLRYGLHRSKRRGISTEFLHHRGYLPGDPLRHLDWRVYARTERFYIKQYVEESAMTLWAVVDATGSMQSEPEVTYVADKTVALPSKHLFASRLAAAMCCLAVNQQDRAGLVVAGPQAAASPAGSSATHLSFLLHRLVTVPVGGAGDICGALRMIAEQASGGCVVAVVSDLSFAPAQPMQALKALRARGHDVILFHVATPYEADFDFNRWVDFRCAEASRVRHRVDATLLRQVYVEERHAFLAEWRDFCAKQRIDFVPARTDGSVRDLLNRYLQRRMMEG